MLFRANEAYSFKITPISTIKQLPMKTYLCIVCGFIYDESNGRPEDGIPPGTTWDQVPSDWACPDCGAGKDSFEMMAI